MRKRISAIFLSMMIVVVLQVSTYADIEKFSNLTLSSLVYDGRSIWGLDGRTLYQGNPVTDDILNKLTLSQDGERLAYDGRNILISQNMNKKIFSIDQNTGEMSVYLELSSLASPNVMHILPLRNGTIMSITFNEEKLWIGCGAGYSTSIYEVDPVAKQVVSQFFAPGPTPYSLYHRNGHLWVLDKDACALHCMLNLTERGIVEGIPVAPGSIDMTVIEDKVILAGANNARNYSPISVQLMDKMVDEGIMRSRAQEEIKSKPFTCDSRSGKYAVIISGDTANSSFDEFWTDCIFLCKMLDNDLGFSSENIYFLYDRGSLPTFHTTDKCPTYYYDNVGYLKGPASKSQISTTLTNIANQNPEVLFIFTFDHGASNKALCLPGEYLYPSEFSDLLTKTGFDNAKIFIYMQQCYSGGFLTSYIQGRNKTAILTACNDKETAHRSSHTEYLNSKTWHHGEFNWWLFASLKYHPHGATPITPATNVNSKSVVGIRNYVITNASGSEHELYDDDNGIGNGETIGQYWPDGNKYNVKK